MKSSGYLQLLVAAVAIPQALAFHDLPSHHLYARDGSVSRSPCPGLNTLANEGFLPQNGRNITTDMLKTALMNVYNFDSALATFFSGGAVETCKKSKDIDTIDLEDLDKHNIIEHDASMTRHDISQGDNHSLQPDLLQAMLDDSKDDFITKETLAVTRKRRGAESQAAGSPPLGLRAITAYAECALMLKTMGHLGNSSDMQIPKSAVQRFYAEERLPEGWSKPPGQLSLINVNGLAAEMMVIARAS